MIHNCSKLRYEEEGAWLGEDIIKAYTELHRQGFAASVEVWEKDDSERGKRLVGGLYGVNIGSAFFGESMFSLVSSIRARKLRHSPFQIWVSPISTRLSSMPSMRC